LQLNEAENQKESLFNFWSSVTVSASFPHTEAKDQYGLSRSCGCRIAQLPLNVTPVMKHKKHPTNYQPGAGSLPAASKLSSQAAGSSAGRIRSAALPSGSFSLAPLPTAAGKAQAGSLGCCTGLPGREPADLPPDTPSPFLHNTRPRKHDEVGWIPGTV